MVIITAEQDETHKAKTTPMMIQYSQVKQQHPEALLFYRMGDFYELFFEDAIKAAKILDIALTHRGKEQGKAIPMCGVPHHSYEPYLHKLIQAGHKVAICEQMETPEEAKKRGYKAVVRREIVRIVTPGTVVEETLLEAHCANYLLSLAHYKKDFALAWVDMSTGEFWTAPAVKTSLLSDIIRLSPKEVLVSDAMFYDADMQPLLKQTAAVITAQADNMFEPSRAQHRLQQFFQVASLEAFGTFLPAQLAACGVLIDYIDLTQKGSMPRLNPPRLFCNEHFMTIDPATRRGLEIHQTLAGQRQGSLIGVLDQTVTSAGARLLNRYIAAPLCHSETINRRLDTVECFLEQPQLRQALRGSLASMPDIERALSRLCLNKGRPKDLGAIRDGLQTSSQLTQLLQCDNVKRSAGLADYVTQLGEYDELLALLCEALEETLGGQARDGGFIKEGYHEQLDALRRLRDHGQSQIEALREEYRRITGITTLKIQQNNVLGWFVEVTPNQAVKVTDPIFVHRQTLASAVRFTTETLRQLESDLMNAKEQALCLEIEIYDIIVAQISASAPSIIMTAQAAAGLDVTLSLAYLAEKQGYVRPVIDESDAFSIREGRHPVVETMVKDQFVANDCNLSRQQRLWLITGPNMAGKSTFLRQNALIAIMAQLGSFVPAKQAHIGVVDKIFSRIGAADDLAHGQSTFMVEMVETAAIIHHATRRSLVIMDEIGRGTATYDGLSIAWAVVEYLHNYHQCRALFATHYHELTCLAANLSALQCQTMQVKEWQGDVIFMHKVIEGIADRSYGIYVAKLAGLPVDIVQRAYQILEKLQVEKIACGTESSLSGYSQVKPEEVSSASPLQEKLANTNIDELSPRQALEVLYVLKSLI